jgi:hypothetical protein
MHIERITYTESESIESYYADGLKKWAKREQSVTVFLTDKDDENRADQLAKDFVREKLYGSKEVQPATNNYVPEVLPEIQIENKSMEQQIMSCMTLKELKDYEYPASLNPKYQLEYDKRMYILTH